MSLGPSAFWRRGRHWLAWGLLACGLLPLGFMLTGAILKDCLMAGALLVATGLLALRDGRRLWWADVTTVVMLALAASLRFNAFIACLPLAIPLLPEAWRRDRRALVLAVGAVTIALMAIMPIANRLIGAKPSGVELSLMLFDLGGITEYSGVSVFPEALEVASPVALNHRCYRPNKWDSYSDWVEPECPLGFTAWNDNIDPEQTRPLSVWWHAVLAHPAAYAEHRLHHFAINTRLLPLADAIERPVPNSDAPNPWGFHPRPNVVRSALDRLAMATAHTPLGWPIVWIGLALGVLIINQGLANERLINAIASSSLFYGCGYLLFSVAAELRYHLWTEIAALIALVLLLGDGVRGRRLAWALTPAAAAAAAGVCFRLAG